ncbi:MAG: IS30 family transposase [Psychromonas sp.]|nr:IS30 family transposase [Psychromonas sp.]
MDLVIGKGHSGALVTRVERLTRYTVTKRILDKLARTVTDPYCSWQRGLNENTNGLLLHYWPKSTDFRLIHDEAVCSNLIQLNNRPRKVILYQT